MTDIAGKVIIVSGAAGGIGQELVAALTTAGAVVVATDVDEVALRKLATSTRVQTLKLDVRSTEEWEKVFSLAQALGPVFALINAVGVLKPGYIDKITAKDVDFHIDINVKGVMLGSAIAAREFKKTAVGTEGSPASCAGHIINIASLAGVAPIPGIGLYSASKFAVRGFTLALAGELKDYGVCVTVVCPDAVKTPMLDLQKDYPEAALTFSGSAPLTAKDIADAIMGVLGKNEAEITLPFWRGLFAKTASALPGLAPALIDTLRKAGLENQSKYEKG
ncbi:MAG: SDR family NAD(P)-dependent oxidoreductase [Spirochaetes bacterium]|nr:SDR family NAD(P)-dependent oxidoreductase [Spirochaetota bacterium]MBX3723702.1 SDR family NAD(P)-dependent oxidoreductase [Turneriella sp.]